MHLYEKRPRFRIKGLVITVLVFALLVALFTSLFSSTGSSTDAEQTTLLENAIRNAAVSCYATEGYYPPTLKQLIADYGIIVDRNRFVVRYEVFASNIMPDIFVNFKGESAK